MNSPMEMLFIDNLDEFMKLIEALNAGDQTCPVYLAFRNGAMPHWLIATETMRAQFWWQDKIDSVPTADIVKQMEKITFVIQPTSVTLAHYDRSLSSVDEFPF